MTSVTIRAAASPTIHVRQGQNRVVVKSPVGVSPKASFLFTQASPSAEWIVNHNLGIRPITSVYGPGGAEVLATVIHQSDMQLRVFFNQPQSGFVRCN